jgi:hypothetical protein
VNENQQSLQLFLNGFTARDIAQPLSSFDLTTPASDVLAAIDASPTEVVGVRKAGIVAGWLTRQDLARSDVTLRPFDPASILDETAPLHEVLIALDRSPQLFVRTLGQVGGYISRRDIQKPAMRMWLFGLVTVSELRVTQAIDEVCPYDSWRQYLSEGRLQKALEMQEKRKLRGENRNLLDCLQFADKGWIVASDDRLRERTRFSSKRQVERFVSSLQALRDNLAHAQDISGDWEVIRDLAVNLQRIVGEESPPNRDD